MLGRWRRSAALVAVGSLSCGGVSISGDDDEGRGGEDSANLGGSVPHGDDPPITGGKLGAGGPSGPFGEGASTGGSGSTAGGPPMLGDPPDRGTPVPFQGPGLRDYTVTRIDGELRGTLGGGAFVGDLDGDGYDELLVSDYGGAGPPESIDVGTRGATYLFYGRPQFPARLSALDADLVIRGGGESQTMAALGDLDADGFEDCGFVSQCDCGDLATGAYCACASTSGLHILFGGPDRYSGVARADEVGVTFPGRPFIVRSAGDVNGDGFSDVLVGVSTVAQAFSISAPEIRVLLGGPGIRTGRSLDLADASFDGATQDDTSASGAGDVDGDGYGDILVGGAETLLYYGGPNRFVGAITRSAADASFAHPSSWYLLQPAGDIDGDGFADLALPGYSEVALYYGRAQRFAGAISAGWRDASVAAYTGALEGFGVGDVDSDGSFELLLADPKEETNGFQSGALFLLPGAAQRMTQDYLLGSDQVVMYGDPTEDETSCFGYGTASGGDVNGDGFDDIVSGKTGNDIGDEGGGQAILIFGGPLGP